MDDLKAMGLNAFNSWHYCDVPLVLDGVVPPAAPEVKNEILGVHLFVTIKNKVNLTWALLDMEQSYKTTRATPGSLAFAVRALVHLVGDMGQPLHSTSLYSNDFRNGDQGGNRFKVIFRGMSTNLHSFFDSGAFRLNDTLTQPMTPLQSTRVQELADLAVRLYPRSSFADVDVHFNPKVWVAMAHSLAVSCKDEACRLDFVFLDSLFRWVSEWDSCSRLGVD